jgi:hypothetical protein
MVVTQGVCPITVGACVICGAGGSSQARRGQGRLQITGELIAAHLPQVLVMHDASHSSQARSCSREPPRGNQDHSWSQHAHQHGMGTCGARLPPWRRADQAPGVRHQVHRTGLSITSYTTSVDVGENLAGDVLPRRAISCLIFQAVRGRREPHRNPTGPRPSGDPHRNPTDETAL